MPTSYRLPNGTTTADAARYLAAWEPIIQRAEALLPGYRVASLNPDVHLVATRMNGLGEMAIFDQIRLSLHALQVLSAQQGLPALDLGAGDP